MHTSHCNEEYYLNYKYEFVNEAVLFEKSHATNFPFLQCDALWEKSLECVHSINVQAPWQVF